MDPVSDEGYIQDFKPGKKQALFLYCRMCRRTFQVTFKPRPKATLQCVCGRRVPLEEMDVFRYERDAQDHAEFYEKVYRAAKEALANAGIPVPASQRIPVAELRQSGELLLRHEQLEEDSDVRNSYVEGDAEYAPTEEDLRAELREFKRRLKETEEDPLAFHEVLSELVEWAYVRRHMDQKVLEWFLRAGRQDMKLASEVIEAAKRRKREGERVRLSFTSFKHLAKHYEESGNFERALDVTESAAGLGLKGYKERSQALRRKLEE